MQGSRASVIFANYVGERNEQGLTVKSWKMSMTEVKALSGWMGKRMGSETSMRPATPETGPASHIG